MNWKIWKTKTTEDSGKTLPEKLPKPREIPEPVGRHLVVKLKKDPDWVWSLKAVVRQKAEGKSTFDVRVFDDAQVASHKIIVKNYTSLDAHPDLVLYEGWFDKKTGGVEIQERGIPTPRAA